ncbi:hypothetical protein [Clostridium perfringens]|uniref:hypothetical protein n=1 Tax=Clostridium perfringens TaxID=1502 RepID=UPI0024695DB0|nr:hypothetical protein [Clostridium perfringens]MDH5085882.1 hypothetical protein [Clostridium perfringens]
MSIITTVYIPEGIVMAADSRLTGTTTYPDGTKDRHTLSDNSQKLFLIKNNSIGISCCGDAKIAGKSVGDFIREFEIKLVKESDTVIDITPKLKDYTIKEHGEGVIYHVAGFINDVQHVYQIQNNEIVRKNINNNVVVTGVSWNGELEAISRLLAAQPNISVDFDFMQLKDGVDFAEFLIDMTIKYLRFRTGIATCGGPIDILLITKDEARWIKHKILKP